MKFLKFTRYAEWWEYKLVPLLSVGYATLLLNNYPLDQAIPRLIFLLLAIITGAIYVSVINDLTDIREDARAGKSNRMAGLSPLWRGIIVSTCLTAGIAFGYQIWPDRLSLFFYAMAWIVFSLYSLPPVRLKKRGIWGVFCDASGAHLFPTLLIASNLTYYMHVEANLLWYLAIGTWALCYGLRGILWHQFYDRENDIRSGTTTFASRTEPGNFKITERLIFGLETATFILLLFYIVNIWIVLSICAYIVLVLIRRQGFNYRICLIISPASAPYQLIMNDYYLVLFPLSLLFTAALHYKYGWIVLCIHLLLFPKKAILIAKDLLIFSKKIRVKN
jgi:hypothetical protein